MGRFQRHKIDSEEKKRQMQEGEVWNRDLLCEEQDLKASGEGSLLGCNSDYRFCFTIISSSTTETFAKGITVIKNEGVNY